MNWRWIIPTALAFAFIEFVAGIAAYSSATWNFQRTEVLTGWAAVREVCLIFMPLTLGGCAVFLVLFIAALNWANRGDR